MHPLSGDDQGLSKAISELPDNPVNIRGALDFVGHPGEVNLDLRRGETVDSVPLRNVPWFLSRAFH